MPPLYDLVWSVTAILLIALVVIALISIARHAAQLSSTATVVWIAVAVFVAVLGPLAWFVVGRPAARALAPDLQPLNKASNQGVPFVR